MQEKNITMIHFEPCKAESSWSHNVRHKELNYTNPRSGIKNSSFYFKGFLHDPRKVLAELRQTVKEKTGRRMQDKAQPIKEGVLLTKQSTTRDEVINFMRKVHEITGWIPMQGHMHLDEGHIDKETGQWVPNPHAHLLFCTVDRRTGKRIKRKTRFNPKTGLEEEYNGRMQMSDVQTEAAKVLNMERGVCSDLKHRDAIEFKIREREKELKELMNKVRDANKLKDLFDPSIVPLSKKEIITSLADLGKEQFLNHLTLPPGFEVTNIKSIKSESANGFGKYNGAFCFWFLERSGVLSWSNSADSEGRLINPVKCKIYSEPAFKAAWGTPEIQESLREAIIMLSAVDKKEEARNKGQSI